MTLHEEILACLSVSLWTNPEKLRDAVSRRFDRFLAVETVRKRLNEPKVKGKTDNKEFKNIKNQGKHMKWRKERC